MITFILNVLWFIILVPVALWMVNFLLRRLDKVAGFDWEVIRERISSDPIAAAGYFGAGYFGLRFLGVCVMLQAVIGRYLF
jgi:hypothetical protein